MKAIYLVVLSVACAGPEAPKQPETAEGNTKVELTPAVAKGEAPAATSAISDKPAPAIMAASGEVVAPSEPLPPAVPTLSCAEKVVKASVAGQEYRAYGVGENCEVVEPRFYKALKIPEDALSAISHGKARYRDHTFVVQTEDDGYRVLRSEWGVTASGEMLRVPDIVVLEFDKSGKRIISIQ